MGAKREGAGGVERTTKVIYGWLVVLSCNHSPSCDMAGHSQALQAQAPDHPLGEVDIVICGKFLFLLRKFRAKRGETPTGGPRPTLPTPA